MQPTTSLQSFETRFLRPQLSRKDLDRKIFQVCDLRLWGLQPWVETLKNIDIIVEKNQIGPYSAVCFPAAIYLIPALTWLVTSNNQVS